jgi:hypothetical protein
VIAGHYFFGGSTLARKQMQMGVALPDDLRWSLEEAAKSAGHSIAEEIRLRLSESFARDTPSHLNLLLNSIMRFVALVKKQTDKEWSADAEAATTLRAAIDAYLRRHYHADDEKRMRTVFDSSSLDEIGESIEADDYAAWRRTKTALVEIEKSLEAMKNVALPQAGQEGNDMMHLIFSLEMQHRRLLRSLGGGRPDGD